MNWDNENTKRMKKTTRGNGQLKHKAQMISIDGTLTCGVCGWLISAPHEETDEMLCASCAEARRDQQSDEYD